MKLPHMYGMSMKLPDGKLPGFYAQIIKALAESVHMYDRDKELLIVEQSEDVEAAAKVLGKYKVVWEPLNVWALPSDVQLSPLADDAGFETRSGNVYLYKHLCTIFKFAEQQTPSADSGQALQQMKEHTLAEFDMDGVRLYAILNDHQPLIERIAQAYHCRVVFADNTGLL